MNIRDRLSGNEAIVFAMKQIDPDVVAAYPITPSTEIPQLYSMHVANGEVDTDFIAVESEHSAMSACMGASAAGVRAMTATSSQGLAYMWEVVNIASSMRLPIVMTVVNRTISGTLNIHNDHSDSMGCRDTGWIQIYCENNQEAYDSFLMAPRIAEEVRLPIMICYDGFITSHSVENIELLDDVTVKKFIGEYNPAHYLLNPDEFASMGPLDLQAYHFEHKRQEADAMRDSKVIIQKIAKEFSKISGRKYELFEEYMMDDAEVAIVLLNSTAGTAKATVNDLRKKGIKAGLIKPRVFRPFPVYEIAQALKKCSAIAVLDKVDSINGAGGPLFTDITSAMYVNDIMDIPVINYVYGLGGRDTTTKDIDKVFRRLIRIKDSRKIGEIYNYLGVRE